MGQMGMKGGTAMKVYIVQDYLGAGHFVTEYEVKTEITNQ